MNSNNPNNPICPVCKWPSDKYLDGSCWVCYNLKIGADYHALANGALPEDFPKGFPHSRGAASKAGSEFYFTGKACTKGKHPRKVLLISPKKCIGCPRVDARRKAETRYKPEFECDVCKTYAPRIVKTDVCTHCHKEKLAAAHTRTIRSVARHAGEKHYTPDTPCLDCDTSERRVYDNKCVHCCSATDSRRSGTQAFIDANPELIVTRDMARTVGFKVFRTGKPCSRGHAGFRYVTTNGCITCLRGK